jgi:hypothetical protein
LPFPGQKPVSPGDCILTENEQRNPALGAPRFGLRIGGFVPVQTTREQVFLLLRVYISPRHNQKGDFLAGSDDVPEFTFP